jgi:hypothetical protein
VGSAGAATLEPLSEEGEPHVFAQPIFVSSDPDDPDRLLIVERAGRVQEFTTGEATLHADISDVVSCCGGERGLLSIAPAPDFATTGAFYAAYAGKAEVDGGDLGDIHVDYVTPTGGEDGEATRKPIMVVPHSVESNHNGGQLQFGPDGHLYLSTGDGGGGGDPEENGQDLESPLGKILRFDPEPAAEGVEPTYTVPAGNPFVGAPGLDEIWAYGLRNPWRFSFDRETGDMVIGDVGQGLHEEIDFAPAPLRGRGANYGWNCREGLSAYTAPGDSCVGASAFTEPVLDYPHTDPEDGSAHGCSITGGYVVRDASLGDLAGRYVYADFCVGQIRSIDLAAPGAGDRSEGLSVANPTSFGEDACGRVYVAANNGTVSRFVGESEPNCEPPPEEEEPPKEELPVERPPAAGGDVEYTPGPTGSGVRFRVRLSVTRQGRKIHAKVSVSPCSGPLPGTRVQLNRGGKRIRWRATRSCSTAFRLAGAGRVTLRGLLIVSGGRRFRSPRALVPAAP